MKHLDPTQREKHGEKHITAFLEHATGPGLHTNASTRYVNSKGNRDLVLHFGDSAASPVGVLVEVKGNKNTAEMLAPGDLNRKAFQELVYYYCEDEAIGEAAELSRLIVTTGFDWYIFDARDFYRLFVKDKAFHGLFEKFKKGALPGTTTDYFYKNVAGEHLKKLDETLQAVHVTLVPGAALGDTELAHLWRIFGPAYLLKEYPDTRPDANTLNQEFYNELLYLMGLKEQEQGGVRKIGRCPEPERQPGSLLENILYQMDIGHGLSRVPTDTLADYGDTAEVQREEVALALCLMWVNRLLFLKLLEGQLVRYHPAEHAGAFRFLTYARLPDFDELHGLFFGVLNRPPAQRPADVRAAFRELPYLNSSLFQPAPLEEQVLYIRELNDRAGLKPFSHSVLRKKGATAPAAAPNAAGSWLALPYLLGFLDAFDFGSTLGEVGSGEEKGAPSASTAAPARPLLSAAVLGLVFEKINGYRDGSFYTPGFVTMYMARHTLRRAVVRRFTQGQGASKFPELKGCSTWEDLRDSFDKKRRAEYSQWFNGLTVLDPAVGSGHFLVSALNELLALKADLKLLVHADGQYLDYTLRVEHDELIVLDNDTDALALYQVAHYDPETGQRKVADKFTRLQATLFHEKRALIEHALFGVDLNPNSVRICRLRLWIELLKHAYYRPDSGFADLETLPNLDLNVRTGNSLISRHALQAPLGQVFRRSGITVARYRTMVHEYFGASGQAARQQLDTALAELKANVSRNISQADPYVKKLRDAEQQLQRLELGRTDLFMMRVSDEIYASEHLKHTQLVEQRRKELAEHQQGLFFQNAFEWRFEFPEVLDDDAQFQGFDVVMGNPPYIRQEAFINSKPFFKQRFSTFDSKADLYVYFIELGLDLLAPGGEMSLLAPNKWLSSSYGVPLRRWLQRAHEIVEFVDFGDLYVFPQTKAYPAILTVQRKEPTVDSSFRAAAIPKLPPPSLDSLVNTHVHIVSQNTLKADGWTMADVPGQELLDKLKQAGAPLKEYHGGKVYSGIKTGYNAAFIIDAATRDRLIAQDPRSKEVIKPYLVGRDIKHYSPLSTGKFLVLIPSGWTRRQMGWQQVKKGGQLIPPASPVFDTAWEALTSNYPAIAEHLLPFEKAASARSDMGNYWWELRSCDYYDDYERPKIIFPDIASRNQFTIDRNGFYLDMTAFFIPLEDKYLLGILNSKVVQYFFCNISPVIRSGFLRWKRQYIEQIPIPEPTTSQKVELAHLVDDILTSRSKDDKAKTVTAEEAIDKLVYQLYGLTTEESELVRDKVTAFAAAPYAN
ncbi:TaqI-like C-terminal specificity domain-containing protein [Hymenobacter ginsengisoli]|uniref:site-specific DNA-methyltransferase (adenine-specific) n=1 Tax=Hymenobacter ginsengisoli TaxID=1051626 RepID=A0ABP8QQP2_9BACT